MSTDFHFQPVTPIEVQDLFDGRLKHFGIIEILSHPLTKHGYRILSDGQTFISVWGQSGGAIGSLALEPPYLYSSAGALLKTIAKSMGTEFVMYTEHEPQYWGFDTQQEWDVAMEKLNRKQDDMFYADVLQFVAGDDQVLKAGTVGHGKGEVARKLISKEPSLIRPDKRDELLQAIDKAYSSSEKLRCANAGTPPWM
jgi:hypothetical protein